MMPNEWQTHMFPKVRHYVTMEVSLIVVMVLTRIKKASVLLEATNRIAVSNGVNGLGVE